MIRKYKAKNINRFGEEIRNRKVVVWGISISGLDAIIELSERGAEVVGFTDSFVKDGSISTEFAGRPIYSFEQINNMSDICLYISTVNEDYLFDILDKTDQLERIQVYCRRDIFGPGLYDTEKLTQIISENREAIENVRSALWDKKSIITFDNLLQYRKTNDRKLISEVFEGGHDQYFPDSSVLNFEKNEIFVDAGAYNGETSYAFSKFVGDYAYVYIMEPDDRLYYITKEYVKLKKMKNVSIIKKGAYAHTGVVGFKNDFVSGSSNINVDGNEEIETISIDEMLEGKRASYIKMDIEGAEREALEGCSYTIKKYHPKLAISIYHMEDDLWKIPDYLIRKYPFYKFSIRHYTKITTETILYAQPL